jgi:WhiB family redox-sensing transcriptional regulator
MVAVGRGMPGGTACYAAAGQWPGRSSRRRRSSRSRRVNRQSNGGPAVSAKRGTGTGADSGLSARQRIIRLFLRVEVDGGRRLATDEVAEQTDTSRTYARTLLRTLRAARDYDPTLRAARAELAGRAEPQPPDPDQLAALAAHYNPPPAASTADLGAGGRGVYRPSNGPVGARIEGLWLALEVDGGRRLSLEEVVGRAGCSRAHADTLLRDLRAERDRDPSLARLRAAVAERQRRQADRLRVAVGVAAGGRPAARTRHRDDGDGDGDGDGERAWRERDWRRQAACAGKDPELFFPDHGQERKALLAKQVCGSCPVKAPCLHEALTGPQALDDHAGIFGGLTPSERLKLRRDPARARNQRAAVTDDRTLAAAAYALAWQTSMAHAARQYGIGDQRGRAAARDRGGDAGPGVGQARPGPPDPARRPPAGVQGGAGPGGAGRADRVPTAQPVVRPAGGAAGGQAAGAGAGPGAAGGGRGAAGPGRPGREQRPCRPADLGGDRAGTRRA